MKIAIVTDSTAYLPADIIDQHNIHIVPLSVMFGQEIYQEEVDITAETFYEKVKSAETLPKTSQPSIGEIQNKYNDLAQDYEAIISIHLSSGISGTYQAAINASQDIKEADVFVYDSEISCIAQGFYCIEAAEMAESGYTPEAIIERLDVMKSRMNAYFMVDDLSHLQRGGRLNGAQAFVGSLLQVKPILHFVDKIIVPFEKIRTRNKALKRIKNMLKADLDAGGFYKVAVIHANRKQAALDTKQEIAGQHSNFDGYISYFGPVIGTHLGEGAIGICWYRQ